MNSKQFVIVAYMPIDESDFESEADAIIDDVPVLFIDAISLDGGQAEVAAAHEAMAAKHDDRVFVMHHGTVKKLVDILSNEAATPKTFPPVFTHAMNQYKAIAAKHGDESEQARDAFLKAMLLAPEWFTNKMHKQACELGLMIPPCGYSDDGEPVYNLSDLAKHLGISADEAERNINTIISEREKLGMDNFPINPLAINRRQ